MNYYTVYFTDGTCYSCMAASEGAACAMAMTMYAGKTILSVG